MPIRKLFLKEESCLISIAPFFQGGEEEPGREPRLILPLTPSFVLPGLGDLTIAPILPAGLLSNK